jgi:purine-binding chemotaxis protein CheW
VTLKTDEQSAGPGGARGTRAALVAEVRRHEEALRRAHRELLAAGGERLPGIHLVFTAGGLSGVLPTAKVVEVVRLVATTPLAGAPPHVLGTFVCRGEPVVAVDLAALLAGVRREPPIDAEIVVLAGVPAVGLVVDRVQRIVDGPVLFDGDAALATPAGWRGSPLVVGLCVDGGEVLPLVDPGSIAVPAPERPA